MITIFIFVLIVFIFGGMKLYFKIFGLGLAPTAEIDSFEKRLSTGYEGEILEFTKKKSIKKVDFSDSIFV